jgi:hypothetical protein
MSSFFDWETIFISTFSGTVIPFEATIGAKVCINLRLLFDQMLVRLFFSGSNFAPALYSV